MEKRRGEKCELKSEEERWIFIEGTWGFRVGISPSSQTNSSLLVATQYHIWETDGSSFNLLLSIYIYVSLFFIQMTYLSYQSKELQISKSQNIFQQ